jgi:DNA modification methylase
MTAKNTYNNRNLINYDDEIRNSFLEIIENTPDFWDFKNENTKEYSHGYHSYPAMMIPQVARHLMRFILNTQPNINSVFDPFMGSGTTLVEGILHRLNTCGTDLNPLARLIGKVKTTPILPTYLLEVSDNLVNSIRVAEEKYLNGELEFSKPDFKNIDYWFKPYVIDYLQLIKKQIKLTDDSDVKMFFWLIFSETVRYVSNTRNSEFKLYRIAEEKLDDWNPDVISIFTKFLYRNIETNLHFYNLYHEQNPDIEPIVDIHDFNTKSLTGIPDSSFDLLITSPPYGDSKTTVAYGQFSRLSLQWLDFNEIGEDEELFKEINQIDNLLLGGKVDSEVINNLQSDTLKETIDCIAEVDVKRAFEVLQFYVDLDKALSEITRVMKPNSYQCWVVGNRTVKKKNILTHKIIIELFSKYNVSHILTFERNIPNKKMPKENSPTNKSGEKVTTMNGEIIFVLRKN